MNKYRQAIIDLDREEPHDRPKDLELLSEVIEQCEKQEKLLNIIKEKCEIDSCFIRDTRDYKDYLRLAKKLLREAYILTIDEYKILKKWLPNA